MSRGAKLVSGCAEAGIRTNIRNFCNEYGVVDGKISILRQQNYILYIMKLTRFIVFPVLALALFSCNEKIEPVALPEPEVVVDEVTENSVTFSWKPVEKSTGYEYRMSEASDAVAFAKVDAATLSVTIDGLQCETEYVFKVRTLGDGESYLDSGWKETVVTTPAPAHVKFADKVFEKLLLGLEPAVDVDGDGSISFEEAAAVKEINIGYQYAEDATDDNTVSDLAGIEYFTSLEALNLKYHRVADATPVEGISSLQSLNLGENPISKLDISALVNLTDLRLYGTGVSELDLAKTPLIKSLYLQRTAFTELDLTPLAELEEAYINEAKLQTLNASGLKNLNRLDAVKNELTSVDVKDCSSLVQLHLNSNKLTSMDLAGLSSLIILNLYENELTTVNFSGAPKLMQLFIFDNQLSTVKFSGNRILSQLFISNNPLKTLDLSFNANIAVLEAINMPALEEINLQNDACDDFPEYTIVEGNTALQTVYVDAGEEYDYVSGLFKDVPSVSVVTEEW